MELPPESYIDSMRCDPGLLVELGRVSWAAARLHFGVRHAINRQSGSGSDQPFGRTLGQAVSDFRKLASAAGRPDQVTWTDDVGRPALKMRNGVVHAVTFTAADGGQAIGTVDHSRPGRFLLDDLRQVSLHLIHASMTLPV